MPVREWLAGTFWRLLREEVEAYAKDGGGELDPQALATRTRLDEARCLAVYDFRALHRSVLLYAFLRWRKMLADVRAPAARRTAIAR